MNIAIALRKICNTLLATLLLSTVVSASAVTLTIGSVNNGDMVKMKELSKAFLKENPDIQLRWKFLKEGVLRQQLTHQIGRGKGDFDVITIGMYEAPIWGRNQWLVPMERLPSNYDVNDIFPSIRSGLSYNGSLYALPFYGESSITYFRKDLFDRAGLSMPIAPTWDEIESFAERLHNPAMSIYGICLRGKAGWGENMALLTTIANGYGGRWFNEQWESQLETSEWYLALEKYSRLLSEYGPPNAHRNGYNENLELFRAGQCAMWVDATVAGSYLVDKESSKVASSVGFALAPAQKTRKGSSWLWAWALAVPAISDAVPEAVRFVTWATSKGYLNLVEEEYGLVHIPPGTRLSTYRNPGYQRAAPFAKITYDAILNSDPEDSTLLPTPYTGIQFVPIKSFQIMAGTMGKHVSKVLTGKQSVGTALQKSHEFTRALMSIDTMLKERRARKRLLLTDI